MMCQVCYQSERKCWQSLCVRCEYRGACQAGLLLTVRVGWGRMLGFMPMRVHVPEAC